MENEEFATFTAAGNSDSQKLLINNGAINECTIRTAFRIDDSARVNIYRMDGEVKYGVNSNKASGEIFWSLHKGWKDHKYIVDWTAPLSRPGTPMKSIEKTVIGSKRKRVDDGLPMDTQDLNDDKIDYIERLKKFMFYSILTKTESGSFENASTIRSCVTVAKKEYALMAAHCLPDDIPEQFQFAIYNQDDKPHIVQIEYINKNLDFAVLKTVEKEFEKYPNSLAFPETGIQYTCLGYHAYGYQISYTLSAFFGLIRNNQHSPNLEFVLGSPGTTRGCSGSGAFSHLSLIGIVVSGRISPQNVYSSSRSLSDHVAEACIELAEPSYSHIVPSSTIFALLEQHKFFRLYHPLP